VDKLFPNQQGQNTYIEDYTDKDMKVDIEKLNREQRLDDNKKEFAEDNNIYRKDS